MRVFVTGASGFIGSAVVRELLAAGHQVVGLARSDASADKIAAAGAHVHRGDLKDLESLKRGAESADGIIHNGYTHDFFQLTGDAFMAGYIAATETDRQAIQAMGSVLEGSNRPLVIASGTAVLAGIGRPITENDEGDADSPHANGRLVTEHVLAAMAARGVRTSSVRLSPTVHGEGDVHGFIPNLIRIAKAKGVSAYVGDGMNRWPAVHRLDAAQLFRLALEQAAAGTRLHAAAEEGVPLVDIATAIGKQLDVPVVSLPSERAAEHFGGFGAFAVLDNPTSNTLTRERVGWNPTHPKLLEDIEHGAYGVVVMA